MQDISFICGLGNPGAQYSGTRHNLGFDVLDRLSGKYGLPWKESAGRSLTALWKVRGRKVLLVKPLTFMNLSGEALRRTEGLLPSSLLVVCDDINLPLGTVRMRAGGGPGGHRGLESIEEALGTRSFPRLRLGCGPAPEGEEWSDYVLGPFSSEELPLRDGLLDRAVEAVETAVRRDIQTAMNEFNRRIGTD